MSPGAMMPFDRLVDRHGATVLRVCRSILRPADADDAWSETFLSALLAWPSLDPDTDLEAWLVTVARRKAVDVVRGDRRRAVPVEVLPEPPAGPSFDEVLARDDELLTAVRALPDRQRAAVVASDGIAALRTRLTS